MELQEFSLIGLVGELRYPLSPLYPDVRGRLITELTGALDVSDWGWGDEVVNLVNKDRSWTFLAGGRQARAQLYQVQDIDAAIAAAMTLF